MKMIMVELKPKRLKLMEIVEKSNNIFSGNVVFVLIINLIYLWYRQYYYRQLECIHFYRKCKNIIIYLFLIISLLCIFTFYILKVCFIKFITLVWYIKSIMLIMPSWSGISLSLGDWFLLQNFHLFHIIYFTVYMF